MKTYLDNTTEFPPQGEPVPTSVRIVCEHFEWICYSIDRHPGNLTVVTFDDARFEGEPYALFEVGLRVVDRMAAKINGRPSRRDDPWASLF